MIAGYLSDVSEPALRAPDTVVGAESGPDGSTHTLGSRAALSGTSSLTFPGFVLNRALPGAVVAAIVFAVPGLSLEHLQSSGKTVTGPVTIDLQSLRRASSNVSCARMKTQIRHLHPCLLYACARLLTAGWFYGYLVM